MELGAFFAQADDMFDIPNASVCIDILQEGCNLCMRQTLHFWLIRGKDLALSFFESDSPEEP